MKKKTKVSLAWQILLALVLGILLGSYLHYHADGRDWLIANFLTPAGDIFIHLISAFKFSFFLLSQHRRWLSGLPALATRSSWAESARKPLSILK